MMPDRRATTFLQSPGLSRSSQGARVTDYRGEGRSVDLPMQPIIITNNNNNNQPDADDVPTGNGADNDGAKEQQEGAAAAAADAADADAPFSSLRLQRPPPPQEASRDFEVAVPPIVQVDLFREGRAGAAPRKLLVERKRR